MQQIAYICTISYCEKYICMAKNQRTTQKRNDYLLLYNEVDGLCPKCFKPFPCDKNGETEMIFEIAHIYPLNATDEEKELLKNEEKLSEDLNDTKNLICLCPTCHRTFDKSKTVEEYRELLKLKKGLIEQDSIKRLWNTQPLDREIDKIIDFLQKEDNEDNNSIEILYNPQTIDNKTDNTITLLVKRSIHYDVQNYYVQIKEKLKQLDEIKPLTTENISIQIRAYYLSLKTTHNITNQKTIYNALVEWLHNKTNQTSKEACQIIISYFVQNCEVF